MRVQCAFVGESFGKEQGTVRQQAAHGVIFVVTSKFLTFAIFFLPAEGVVFFGFQIFERTDISKYSMSLLTLIQN